MQLKFSKYQGAGNDFIIVDDHIKLSDTQIQFLCDRHFGIGSDGLMLVGLNHQKEVSLTFYNPDASLSFCGNGSRCAVAYAVKYLGADANAIKFSAFDGLHSATYANNYALIDMHINADVEKVEDFYFINTGAPHVVYKVDDVNAIDIKEKAKYARHHQKFQPIGTNVNFYDVSNDGALNIRTFEKGVENETLACGTGITAVALVHHFLEGNTMFTQKVNAQGGKTEVKKNGNGLWLGGPAVEVFKGEIELQ